MSREMKDSGIEWMQEIPTTWERTKLRNVLRCSICDGPHETPVLHEDGVPFISVDSLNESENIDLSICKKYISEEDYLRYKEKANLEQGDILFTKAATIGKTAIVGSEKFMVWSPIAIIKTDCSKVENRFIYFTLSCPSLVKYISLLGTYNTQVNVGMRTLESAMIPIPPITEQRRIADRLDVVCEEIDSVLVRTRSSIEEYKKLKQAAITQAVTKGIHKGVEMASSKREWIRAYPKHWKEIRIKWLLDERKEHSTEGKEEPLSMSQKYGLIPTKEMDMVPNMAASFVGAKLAYKGDLVFNKLKAHLGVFAVSAYDGLVSPDYAVYYATGLANMKYLEYLFKTPQYIAEFKKKSTGVGAGLTRLYTAGLYSIYCALPPIDEQKEIADYLDRTCSEIDTLIAKKEQYLVELENYKKSLIYEYVTGKKEVSNG